ncbi:MAG: potassium transporter TrkG [Candidatus Izemoplasmatales bacterium]|nr:potassium transporter TrkG [Candidatus Izemoplasmatales bacterium]MDY0139549.1 potassium transporter TrkG [Candidatus Izemoplasmatales bacterium]
MKNKKISPFAIVVISFLTIILVGMLLLKLPFSTKEGLDPLSWVDSLFLSTSAVCVTGLSTIPNIAETLSIFGKVVLAILIQIGGLGIVTIAIYVLVVLGIRIGVTERYVIKEALNQHHLGGMIKLVRSIIFTSLIIEGFGFILNFIVFIQDFSFFEAIGHSAFHTISSFNNAGFDILGSSSLQNYSDNLLLNINTMLMIVVGGIGFIVIRDIVDKKSWRNLSIYSKIVLKTTLLLIVLGTLIIKVFEYNNVTWLEAAFQSVTTRTAGFSTVNLSLFSYTTLIVIIIFMFIGASPNSTGGGIKTTTLYIIFKSITSFLAGKPFITHKRKIEDANKTKAFVVAILAFSVTIFMFLIVSLIEAKNTSYDMSFLEVLFETFSAFGTVGLSLGITPYLLPGSKIVLSLLMFIGRLGPITIFGIMNKNWGHPEITHVNYASEKILVG